VPRGTIILRLAEADNPWLITWLPDDPNNPAYPGYTIGPGTADNRDAERVIDAIRRFQSHHPLPSKASMPPPKPPAFAGTKPLNVPGDQVLELQIAAFEFGWRILFSPGADRGYSWAVFDPENTQVIQSGMADTWDEARLAISENLHPPSNEAVN
jgi:hypothetical protein